MRFPDCVTLRLAAWWLTAVCAALPLMGRNLLATVLDSGDASGEQGWAVDISGDLVIVGAPFYQGGSAFIFDLNTGNLIHRLNGSDASANALFGFSVAIDGDLAVVAAGQRNAAYVFDTKTGAELHKLTPTSTSSDYVRSVDISGGVAVLGTPSVRFGSPSATDYGAAFLYDARSGAQLSRINGPTGFSKRGFGRVVAIEGNTAAVIAPGTLGRDDVYVYDAQTGGFQWRYGNTTTGTDLELMDVVIDGERVVVGGGSEFPHDMPEAFVFDRSTGNLVRTIDIRVMNQSDNFRNQIDVSGDRLVVGAWGTHYEQTGSFTGAVYSFDIGTGGFLGTVPNPNPMSGDDFGFAVALENEHLVVGAPSDDGGRGLAYYVVVPEPTTSGLAIAAILACLAWRRKSA
jgi:WD40 repeat protein